MRTILYSNQTQLAMCLVLKYFLLQQAKITTPKKTAIVETINCGFSCYFIRPFPQEFINYCLYQRNKFRGEWEDRKYVYQFGEKKTFNNGYLAQ